MLTADCAPILLADPETRIVAAVHAGWNGALGGIVHSAVAAMEALGAAPHRMLAVVGPCIAQDSYEVGQDFQDRFTHHDPGSDRFFGPGATLDKRQFDLPGILAAHRDLIEGERHAALALEAPCLVHRADDATHHRAGRHEHPIPLHQIDHRRRLEALLDLARTSYDWTVVDLPRHIDHLTGVTLEKADRIYLVLQQSVGHLKDAARLWRILRDDLGVQAGRIEVVVNRYEKSAPVSTRDIVEALANLAEFYAHESCGQCTPCREGSLWMSKALHRLTHGHGRKADADYLLHIAQNIQGRTICAFGEACAWPVLSFVKKFREDFEAKGAADEAKRGAAPQKMAASPH